MNARSPSETLNSSPSPPHGVGGALSRFYLSVRYWPTMQRFQHRLRELWGSSDGAPAPSATAPCWLMGIRYPGGENESPCNPPEGDSMTAADQFMHDFLSRPWFTYRKGFAPFPNTDYSSDVGWGCMLRSGQMLMMECLIVHHLGRDWRLHQPHPHGQGPPPNEGGGPPGGAAASAASEDAHHQRRLARRHVAILRHFVDCPNRSAHAFSLHQLLSQGGQVGAWMGPYVLCHLLQAAARCRRHAALKPREGPLFSDRDGAVPALTGANEWVALPSASAAVGKRQGNQARAAATAAAASGPGALGACASMKGAALPGSGSPSSSGPEGFRGSDHARDAGDAWDADLGQSDESWRRVAERAAAAAATSKSPRDRSSGDAVASADISGAGTVGGRASGVGGGGLGSGGAGDSFGIRAPSAACCCEPCRSGAMDGVPMSLVHPSSPSSMGGGSEAASCNDHACGGGGVDSSGSGGSSGVGFKAENGSGRHAPPGAGVDDPAGMPDVPLVFVVGGRDNDRPWGQVGAESGPHDSTDPSGGSTTGAGSSPEGGVLGARAEWGWPRGHREGHRRERPRATGPARVAGRVGSLRSRSRRFWRSSGGRGPQGGGPGQGVTRVVRWGQVGWAGRPPGWEGGSRARWRGVRCCCWYRWCWVWTSSTRGTSPPSRHPWRRPAAWAWWAASRAPPSTLSATSRTVCSTWTRTRCSPWRPLWTNLATHRAITAGTPSRCRCSTSTRRWRWGSTAVPWTTSRPCAPAWMPW
eukprot:jgi/Mesvir1/421/Mv25063-RA.1